MQRGRSCAQVDSARALLACCSCFVQHCLLTALLRASQQHRGQPAQPTSRTLPQTALLPLPPLPPSRAVLMDWVPRHLRGRVNAVDSVRSFSWSGSAALGGFLIQRYGFQTTFLITAAIKAAAFAPLIVLLAYVPDGMCLPAGARAARLRQQQQARQGLLAGDGQPADEQRQQQQCLHSGRPRS